MIRTNHRTGGTGTGASGRSTSLALTAMFALIPMLALATPARVTAADTDRACVGCHASASERFGHTPHGKLQDMGCDSCHGDGSAHILGGGGVGVGGAGFVPFGGVSPEAIDAEEAMCMSCHQGGEQRHWEASPHDTRGVSCGSCHTVMEATSQRFLLTHPGEEETCVRCHSAQRSKSFRGGHMATRARGSNVKPDAFVECSSCHNAHGTVADALIDAHSVNDKCTSCHADKRGPFLWEHAPVVENCLNCHDPHGSLHPQMLTRAGPRLCQSCHIQTLHPSEARRPGSRMVVGKNCAQCHSAIHGSNHPSGAFLTR